VQENKEKRQNLLFACTEESLHKNDVADSNMDDYDDDDFCAGGNRYFYAKRWSEMRLDTIRHPVGSGRVKNVASISSS